MKTLKTISLLMVMLFSSSLLKAQCGIQTYFGFGVNPNNVHVFIDSSQLIGGWQVTSWHWNFGDGSTSTIQNPNHIYLNAGTYNACLTVTVTNNQGFFCTDSFCRQIVVPNTLCGNLQASFTATASPNTVVLQSTTVNPGTGALFQWWMDGQPITNPTINTSFTITNVPAGSHNFCMYLYTATNILCDSVCQTVFVPGTSPCSGINASFTSSVTGNVATLHTAGIYPPGTGFQWWIDGNSTPISANLTMLRDSGLIVGAHQVCLYVYAPGITTFCDSTCSTITIANPCNSLSAQFTQTYVQNGGVQFSSATPSNTATHLWNFGDGTTSTLENPTHYYAVAGLYTVCLRVNIPGTNCVDSSCHQIQANAGTPCLGFGVTINQTINPNGFPQMQAMAIGGTAPYTYAWSTGETTGLITPTTAGMYCVTVTSSTGCTAVACDSTLNPPCNGLITNITAQNQGLIYTLTASAVGGVPPYMYQWSNNSSTSPILTVTAPGTYCVTVYDNSQCFSVDCFTVPAHPGTDTICGIVFEDLNGNGVMDSSEVGISGAVIQISGMTVVTDSFGHYRIIVGAGVYSIVHCATPGNSFTLPINLTSNLNNCAGYFQVSITGGGTHCGYNFGVRNNSVSICGSVYLDNNNNQQRDSLEQGIGNAHVYITSSSGHVFHAYTNQHGQYCALVPAGSYTIHVTSNTYAACQLTPQNMTLAATTTGNVYGGNNFAMYCQPGLCNLRVNITPHTTVTAGFRAWYSVQVCNNGTSISSGTVNLFYDNELSFDYASPLQASHNASTRTVTWNATNILPGNCRYYWVYFDANLGIQLGQPVFTLVNITPDGNCNDIDMSNNVDTVHQAVTGSWDPNNKLAYVTNHEENPAYQWISSVVTDQRIEYVINFQNLGNAPAVNVVIKDELSSDLDISTFELLGTSHPCVVTSDGAELNFKFSNIMLPAEMHDEPNSHGWVKFAIEAHAGLPAGHVISDLADIYFDFNDAVTTNYAEVTMLDVTGIHGTTRSATVTIAPNPMNRYTEIRVNNAEADNFRFRVTDLTGRVVSETLSSGNVLMFERGLLAGGLYTYQVIQNNQAVATGKLVIE